MYDWNGGGGWMPGQRRGGAFGMLGGNYGPKQVQPQGPPIGRISPIPYTGPQPQAEPMPQQAQANYAPGIMPQGWQMQARNYAPEWGEQMPWQQNWFKRFGGWQP